MYAWPPWPLPLTPGRGQWCDTNMAQALTHSGTISGGDTATRRRQPETQPRRRNPRQPPQECSHYRRRQQPRVSRRSGCFNLAWFPPSRSKTQPHDQAPALGDVANASQEGRYMLCVRLHHCSQSKGHVCQAWQQTLQPFRLCDSSTSR